MIAASYNRRQLVAFNLAGEQYAVAASFVERIIPMAELYCPPETPKLLGGFLNLAGTAVPVIRLHSLFHLPATPLRLWTPLVVLRSSKLRLALIVDKVTRVLAVDDDTLLRLPPGHALNDCIEGIAESAEGNMPVLCPDRLLLQQEGQTVAALQELAQQRLRELEEVEA